MSDKFFRQLQKNIQHGSWYYNGLLKELKPTSLRFNVELALKGDPSYRPSDDRLMKLVVKMVPKGSSKEKRNAKIQELFEHFKELHDINMDKARINRFLVKHKDLSKEDLAKYLKHHPKGRIYPTNTGDTFPIPNRTMTYYNPNKELSKKLLRVDRDQEIPIGKMTPQQRGELHEFCETETRSFK